MEHTWYWEIVFGFLFGVGFGVATWIVSHILK